MHLLNELLHAPLAPQIASLLLAYSTHTCFSAPSAQKIYNAYAEGSVTPLRIQAACSQISNAFGNFVYKNQFKYYQHLGL
eukprot:XP_001708971.1 Hypothetical protein GL50803_23934 [Giardia lamblia ATCC 50803]